MFRSGCPFDTASSLGRAAVGSGKTRGSAVGRRNMITPSSLRLVVSADRTLSISLPTSSSSSPRKERFPYEFSESADAEPGDTFSATGRFSRFLKSSTSAPSSLILHVPGERALVMPGLTEYSMPGLAAGRGEKHNKAKGTSDLLTKIWLSLAGSYNSTHQS